MGESIRDINRISISQINSGMPAGTSAASNPKQNLPAVFNREFIANKRDEHENSLAQTTGWLGKGIDGLRSIFGMEGKRKNTKKRFNELESAYNKYQNALESGRGIAEAKAELEKESAEFDEHLAKRQTGNEAWSEGLATAGAVAFGLGVAALVTLTAPVSVPLLATVGVAAVAGGGAKLGMKWLDEAQSKDGQNYSSREGVKDFLTGAFDAGLACIGNAAGNAVRGTSTKLGKIALGRLAEGVFDAASGVAFEATSQIINGEKLNTGKIIGAGIAAGVAGIAMGSAFDFVGIKLRGKAGIKASREAAEQVAKNNSESAVKGVNIDASSTGKTLSPEEAQAWAAFDEGQKWLHENLSIPDELLPDSATVKARMPQDGITASMGRVKEVSQHIKENGIGEVGAGTRRFPLEDVQRQLDVPEVEKPFESIAKQANSGNYSFVETPSGRRTKVSITDKSGNKIGDLKFNRGEVDLKLSYQSSEEIPADLANDLVTLLTQLNYKNTGKLNPRLVVKDTHAEILLNAGFIIDGTFKPDSIAPGYKAIMLPIDKIEEVFSRNLLIDIPQEKLLKSVHIHKPYRPTDEIINTIDERYSRWTENLTSKQQEYINRYTGQDYVPINRKLRGLEYNLNLSRIDGWENLTENNLTEAINTLDYAISGSPGLDSAISTLYRGSDTFDLSIEEVIKRVKEGYIETDNAFLSTSLDENWAVNFANGLNGGKSPVLYEIASPKDNLLKGIWMGNITKDNPILNSQNEFLTQRNTSRKWLDYEYRLYDVGEPEPLKILVIKQGFVDNTKNTKTGKTLSPEEAQAWAAFDEGQKWLHENLGIPDKLLPDSATVRARMPQEGITASMGGKGKTANPLDEQVKNLINSGQNKFTIGRNGNIKLDGSNSLASRQHLEVEVVDGKYIITDTSTNGTKYSGKLKAGEKYNLYLTEKVTLGTQGYELDFKNPLLQDKINSLNIGQSFTIGRSGDYVTPSSDLSVSNQHLIIRKLDNGLTITDTSTNGSTINGVLGGQGPKRKALPPNFEIQAGEEKIRLPEIKSKTEPKPAATSYEQILKNLGEEYNIPQDNLSFSYILQNIYDEIRIPKTSYSPDNIITSNISEITSKTTPNNGYYQMGPEWHVRYSKVFGIIKSTDVNDRVSLNVVADKQLISNLDKLAEKYNFIYKTPSTEAKWLTRHDPITLYFHKDQPITPEIEKDIIKATNGYIRGNEGLTGRKIADGISAEQYPQYNDLNKFINNIHGQNPDVGNDVAEFIFNNDFNISAGQYEALKRYSRAFGITV